MWIARIAPCFAAATLLFLSAPAQAQTEECTFETFGSAVVSPNGVVTATSNPDDPFGGVAATITPEITFADLERLSTEYNLTNDGAGGGSPRFSITLDTDNNGTGDSSVFVYIGTSPSFTDPGTNTWQTTGNLLDATDDRFDLSQLGGDFYSSYDEALAATAGYPITEIDLVVDGGWFFDDGEQTVLFRNIRINDCIAFDEDADGVPDAIDRCPDSLTNPTVDINGVDQDGGLTNVPNKVNRYGCTIQDLIENVLASNPRNHGQFVSAVAKIANEFQRARLLSSAQASALKSAAARSDVGKPSGGHGHGHGHGNGRGNGRGRR